VKEEIYIVRGLHKPLLGRPAIEQLGQVAHVGTINGKALNPKQHFPQLFEGVGRLQGDYNIELEPGAICAVYSLWSSNPAHEGCQKKTPAYGRGGSDHQSEGTNCLVCGDGCCAENKRQSDNLCGSHPTEPECAQGKASVTRSRANPEPTCRG
jgi:hypothetical protein